MAGFEIKNAIKNFKELDKESAIVLILSSLLMVLVAYQGHPEFFLKHFPQTESSKSEFWSETWRFASVFLLFFIVPLITIKLVFKKSIKDYGLKSGDWKFGIAFTIASIISIPIPLYFATRSKDFLAQYPLWSECCASLPNFFLWIGLYLLFYIGWEFFFRGFIQFSMVGKIPAFYIVMMQTLPSTIIHIGKPEGETLAAIIGGLVFGAVALRSGSILYPLMVHWYLGILTESFCYLHGVGG